LHKHSRATKAIPPLRVWWLALVILVIFTILGAILCVVLTILSPSLPPTGVLASPVVL